jgi:hypothetical protein
MRRLTAFFVAMMVLLALASSLAFGQDFSATLSGVVRDANGGVLPGVIITARP